MEDDHKNGLLTQYSCYNLQILHFIKYQDALSPRILAISLNPIILQIFKRNKAGNFGTDFEESTARGRRVANIEACLLFKN